MLPFINKKRVTKDIYLGTASVQIKSCWRGTTDMNLNANIAGLWRVVLMSWESGTDRRPLMICPFVPLKCHM